MDNANASAIEKLAALFPQCVTERKREDGTLEKAIDIEKLVEEIKPYAIEEEACQQRYAFTWPDKRAYSMLANAPSERSLRPCREESRGRDGAAGAFDSANVYIEGDNLEVLKILRETYFGKVKMIYIDPPYNTGNDFIYRDRFVQDEDEYLENSGQLDEEGARLFPNTESNGRFHTDWLNMIYPRLKVARNLLSDDGVIFISIDDNEAANLRKVCDELFGEGNFVAQLNWKRSGGRQDSKYYAVMHEYILCYAKNLNGFVAGGEVKENDIYPKYDEEKNQYYKVQLLRKWGANSLRENRPNLYYPIKGPDGDVYPIIYQASEQSPLGFDKIEGCWRHSSNNLAKMQREGRIEFQKNKYGEWVAYEKIFAPKEGEERTKKYSTWIDDVSNGTATIKGLFSAKVFDYSKSPELILRFLKMANVKDNALVLDFFSGSATTAHAVMQLNAEDGGRRRFILVQLPEKCGEDSEAFKAGFSNICKIGKERIRRAGDQILRRAIEELEKEGVIEKCCEDAQLNLEKEEEATGGVISQRQLARLASLGYRLRPEYLAAARNNQSLALSSESLVLNTALSPELLALNEKLSLDTGFRVFKVDSSNMLDVYVTPAEFTADSIYEENIKKDRTPDDLLIQAMLDVGLELSSFIEERKIEGKRVFFVGEGRLAACFDAALTGEVILQIAKTRPECFYMRDAGFTCDCDCDNFAQIFKAYSPRTIRRAL